MRKYSILSVANEGYKDFLHIFLNSALENLNLEYIKDIRILNTGIDKDIVKYYEEKNSKIKFISYKSIIKTDKPWDSGWQQNVELKTNFVKEYLKEYKIPVAMVDIDCMFIKDIQDIMNIEGDLGICERKDIFFGSPVIASFVGFINIEKSINFINEWNKIIDSIDNPPKETPALNQMVRENTKYNIKSITHKLVGLYAGGHIIPDTRIIHFKGGDINVPLSEVIKTRTVDRFPEFKEQIENYKIWNKE